MKDKSFRQKVIDYAKKIPRGRVASYGQIAAACGHPRAARQVGGVLRSLDCEKLGLPWWRIVNVRGIISIKGNWTADKLSQKELLEKDGVKCSREFAVDMGKYRHKTEK